MVKLPKLFRYHLRPLLGVLPQIKQQICSK